MSERHTTADRADAVAAAERIHVALVALPGLTDCPERLEKLLTGRFRLLLRRRRGAKVHLAAHFGTPLSKAASRTAAECGWLVSGHLGDGWGELAAIRANAGLIADYENVVLIGPCEPCEVGRFYVDLCRRLRRSWRVINV